jgi:hypothetical protein
VTATTLHFDDAVRLMPSLLSELLAKEDAGYIDTEKTGNGPASLTTVALTHHGRIQLSTATPRRCATYSQGSNGRYRTCRMNGKLGCEYEI